MGADCNLLWVDLEMTGLDPDTDSILEIAVIATDSNLENIIEGPSLIVHQPKEKLANMSSFVRDFHSKNDLLHKVEASTISLQDAEQQVLDFAQQHCSEKFYLAGNSIYVDRGFLHKYMQKLDTAAHYRMVDVSSIKIVILEWYKDKPESKFDKKKTHRALDDIRESIDELRYYRKNFFKNFS